MASFTYKNVKALGYLTISLMLSQCESVCSTKCVHNMSVCVCVCVCTQKF